MNLVGCLLGLTALCACNSEQPGASFSDEQSREVRFTSTVEGVTTRAADKNWTAGDRIGVFMLKAGGSLGTTADVLGDNSQYVTNGGDGRFTSLVDPLQYPEDCAVDFLAYYPYRADMASSYIYKVDVTDQSKPETIDLLYANNLKNRTKDLPVSNLEFTHQLSALILNLQGENLGGVEITLKGLKTKADFALAVGTLTVEDASTADIQMFVNAGATQATALLVPQTLTGALQASMTIDGKTKDFTLSIADNVLKSGTSYTFKVKVTGASGTNSGVDISALTYENWNETPLITEAQLNDNNLQYVVHNFSNGWKAPESTQPLRNYSLLYDKTLRISYWVAYPLFTKCLSGVERKDNYAYDPEVETRFQTDLSGGSYGGSYSRGHQLPSADRECDRESNTSTFYSTNITPQNSNMNSGIWSQLENKVRGWVSGTDTLYVVTGAMPPKSNIQKTKETAIPEYYFKALARKVSGTYRCVAFKFENKASANNLELADGRMTVDQLEAETGFDFFPALEQKGMDESTIDSSWN